ncbi:MAG: RNA 2'-phosphotransferase [Anaerolineae bacterium]|jgi:putative RNA 2'-phosphotransferase
MANRRQLIKLSKFLALILRHHPERFELELDEAGWASLPEILDVLSTLPDFRWADRSAVTRVVQEGTGDGKRRFGLNGDRIRALYGHSLDRRIDCEPVTPPARLYHGTSPEALEAIRRDGLRTMGRQYVHLSADRETAKKVGSRHAAQPVVISVNAKAAHESGIAFYHPEERIYLAEPIPPTLLTLPETKNPSDS